LKRLQYICVLFIICLLFPGINRAQQRSLPFQTKAHLYNYQKPHTLGLPIASGTETVTIFTPNDTSGKYNNGVILFPFKSSLYAQWQSSALDEDAADTDVLYSISPDGTDWSIPKVLAASTKNDIKTSGGWWSDGEKLVSYINVWPKDLEPRGGFTEYIISNDGTNWSDPKPLTNNNGQVINGIFEQDPHLQPGGRIINAIHLQPGLIIAPYYTDDCDGISGWTRGQMQNLPFKANISQAIEPSSFYQHDETIVMIFRDQASSFRKLAAVSRDAGETWTTPVLTDMPDSRSKQCAGNLPDGTAYMIHNPVKNKIRIPLVITLSKDGLLFKKAYLLRAGGDDLQPLKYEGKYKRPGYHYPKSVIWNEYLYVSYATNKEDVQLTRIPIKSLLD
jgi:hypothetical protein